MVVTKQVVEMVNPFVKVMQNKVPEYKGICSLLSIKRPYSSKYSKDIFPRFIRYFINSKCLKISMKEYENLISNKYMSESRSKKCDQSIKILLDSTHLTFPAIMIAMGYISKLKKNTITSSLLHHQNNSEVKILTLALMASMKAHYDNVYSNKSWSTVSGIPLRELNILESNFLRDINFDLYIDEKNFFEYMDTVEKALNEYYKTINENENKYKIDNDTETFENSNIPSKEIQDSRNFKCTTANLTPAPSPKNNIESKYEDKINNSSYNKTYNHLVVPENDYKGNKSASMSIIDNENKNSIYQQKISTPSLYSTESSYSSEISELNLPHYKNNNKKEKENSYQLYKNKDYDVSNENSDFYPSFDNNEFNNKDSKRMKNHSTFLNQSNNNNKIGHSKTMGYFNNNDNRSRIDENQQNSSIKNKSNKYFSSIPSFLHKYQQKIENGEYIKYLDDLDANAKENTGKKSNIKISENELHSSKIDVVHSSPVPIIRSSTYSHHSNDKYYTKNENHQRYIPKRTSSNNLHQLLPKKASSLNLNAQYKNGINNNQVSSNEYNGSIRPSKSISIAYQTKPNQQMVDSSNQLFRHKTVSLAYPVSTNAQVSNTSLYANYPQNQYAIPIYQQQVAYTNQTSVQQVYPYYIPQNSSQIGVILDTNIVQQPIPIPPNSTILQAQPVPPNPIPSPISPQSITYSNGITIRHQNSFQSNYSTPSPYTGNIISTPVNTNIYYSTETPVHIISPPPMINTITNYSYNASQDYNENNMNNHNKLKEKSVDNNFDRLSRKSCNSITDNSSYDSLYYHDIVDNNNTNNNTNNEGDIGNSSIAKRSNTIGSSQNIRNELMNKGRVPNQYLHPNSYSYVNNYGYENPISRSNSYTFDNNSIARANTYSYDSNINNNSIHSYDSTPINPNNGYYEPTFNYSYMSSSYPVINTIYKSNSYSIASSSSSVINDNGSYYSNKRQSNTSSYYKKKGGRYNNDYQYNDGDKSKPFYRSKSVNNKNYKNNNNSMNNNMNNDNNKGPINRSRSYSNSYRYKNKHSNNNGFNNFIKDNKSKLNNISTLNISEDNNSSYSNNNKSTKKYTNEEKSESNKEIDINNEENSNKNLRNEQDKEINKSDENLNNKINKTKSDNDEMKSKSESETFVESNKNINKNSIDEKDQKTDIFETSNNSDSNSCLIDDYVNESSFLTQNDNDSKSDNSYNKNNNYSIIDNKENVNNKEYEIKNINNGDVDETEESSNEEDEIDILTNYNHDTYSKKVFDVESRRYSSVSTYHLDNIDKNTQSPLPKNNKYRYSDCNFDSYEYDSSFHIENIKNDLMDNNNKSIDTIISINSNITDTDFISERDSLKQTEVSNNSYISSLIGSNDDKTDSNINLYINNEDIESLKSYISSIEDYYDHKSEISNKSKSSNLLNTSVKSDSIDNHILFEKVIPKRNSNSSGIKFGLKKAFRTNSTPVYTNSNINVNEEKSWNSSSNSQNLSESKPMEKVINSSINIAGRQEPKIIKVHGSKKSGIKKTMSLILESGSKIFTKKQNQQNQNQNQSQSKGVNANSPYYNSNNKELPPIPADNEIYENEKTELKITKKKHHSFTPSIGSHLLLKLDRDASFATTSSFSKPGSIHYAEPQQISKTNSTT